MAKTINIKWDGLEYTLEYTRRSIETMEKNGFIVGKAEDMPVTVLTGLFQGAFLANHPFVKPDKIEEILKAIPDKKKLYKSLTEMYKEPLVTLMEDPAEDEGKAEWEANW